MNTRVGNLHISPMPGGAGARLEVDGTARMLTVPAGARYVAWQVQTAPLIVTFDGTTPSATNGFVLPAGTTGEWSAATATQAKLIREGATGYLMYSPFTD
jgi:hypothetical protein